MPVFFSPTSFFTRSMPRHLLTALTAGLVLASSISAGWADALTPREAKRALFKGPKFVVQLIEGAAVDAVTMVQVESLVAALQNPDVAAQWQSMGFSINYYGAIAVVPDRPISQDSMGFSDNLHSPAAAVATAIAACNALDGPDCVAVAQVLPKRYKPQDFSLSRAATDGFRDGWGNPRDPQFLAYSPTTGAWVIAKGDGASDAALERCNEQSGQAGAATDCVIGIADE